MISKVLLIFLGLILGLLGAETLTRLCAPQQIGSMQFFFDEALGDIPIPNQHGFRVTPNMFSYRYTNDARGFRQSPNVRMEKAKTILFLGDSFTYGIGVNDHETFSSLTESMLRTHSRINVVNAGNPGKGTDYELNLLQKKGSILKPDSVAVFVYGNDVDDIQAQTYFDIRDDTLIPKNHLDTLGRRKQFFQSNPLYAFLIERSHVFNALKLFIIQRLVPSSPLSAKAASDAHIKLFSRIVKDLQREILNLGAQPYFFYIPSKQDMESAEKNVDTEIYKTINTVFSRAHIQLVSLKEILRDDTVNALYFADGHFTPRAHKKTAVFLSHFFLEHDRLH